MATANNRKRKQLFPLSRITATKEEQEKIDSVSYMKERNSGKRAFDILMEADHYWSRMYEFRRDRQRNKRYCYGKQWDDIIEVDGCRMTEEEYIKRQKNVPLKNNLIRKLVRDITGLYRSQSKEPACVARDRDEQKYGETMSSVLQYNMQLNRMKEMLARTMEEFLISGFIVHRKTYGWRNGQEDCWTDYVQPNNFFIDNSMRDFRGWDVHFLGEIHDITFGQLCEQFADSPEEYGRLKEIYHYCQDRGAIMDTAKSFGISEREDISFFTPRDASLCRVIEVWRKERKPRYRCHDYQNGDLYKIDIEDFDKEVKAVNEERMRMGAEVGMPKEDIPLIKAEWFVDDYWYYYYLSPLGDILREGETPYEHGSHPYIFKAYPFIDGEIHSFVADIIDQQRYTNRLISLYDWVIRSTAKGVLLVPRDCLGETSIEEIAEKWSEVNGVIVFEPSKSGQMPTQVASNAVNIGIGELLNMQLKLFEDISGVHGALQGKPGYSGTSAALYAQQTQNATISLLDLLETFGNFVIDGAYKDVKNMQQYYDEKRVFNISGKSGSIIEYDPGKIRNVEFDLSIVDSASSPVYRQLANDFLMQLWQANAITIEQLLQNGDFPFADELLQSIKSQKEQMAQGQAPSGVSPQLMQQAAAQTNPQATKMLNTYMG